MEEDNYGIFDRTKKDLVKNPETKEIYPFKYSAEAIKFIDNKYGGSSNFCVFDLKKKRCIG